MVQRTLADLLMQYRQNNKDFDRKNLDVVISFLSSNYGINLGDNIELIEVGSLLLDIADTDVIKKLTRFLILGEK